MAEPNDSQRFIVARQRLNEMLEEGTIDQDFAQEVLTQVRLFDERYPSPQDLPPGVTILVMSGRFIQAPSLSDALEIAEREGIEKRPYYCKETLPPPSRGEDISGFGAPNLPILPNLPTLDRLQNQTLKDANNQQYLTGLASE